jgi:hypothetical protein
MQNQSQEARENYEKACSRLKEISSNISAQACNRLKLSNSDTISSRLKEIGTVSNGIERTVDYCSHSVNKGANMVKDGIKSGIIGPICRAGSAFRKSYITRPRKYVTDGISRRGRRFAVWAGAGEELIVDGVNSY